MDTHNADPRYKNAAVRGMWFAAAFAVVCASLAVASRIGWVGNRGDTLLLGMMSLGGLLVFVLSRIIIRQIAP
jgi:hypothetical protein